MFRSKVYRKERSSGLKVTLKVCGEICEFSIHVTNEEADNFLLAWAGVMNRHNIDVIRTRN